MKKRLETEIEQQAPYRQGLEQRIIQKTKQQHNEKYRIVLAGFLVLLLCAGVLFLKEEPMLTSDENKAKVHVEAAMIPGDDGYVYMNSVTKLTRNDKQKIMELQMIEDYYLQDGTYKETKLTTGYLEKMGEEVIDDVQKIVVINNPSTVVVAEEMTGKVVKNGERLVEKQIARIFGKPDEKKNLRHLEYFTVNEHDPIFAPEDILALQHIFGQIVWHEGVEKEMVRGPDAKLALFIRYDANEPKQLLEYNIWIGKTKIMFSGEDGYGELTGEHVVALLTDYLQTDAEAHSAYKTISDPEDIEAAKELIKTAHQMPGIANMADPDMSFELEGEQYFLWWNENGSPSLMHAGDTHTVYTISEAAELKAILKRIQ